MNIERIRDGPINDLFRTRNDVDELISPITDRLPEGYLCNAFLKRGVRHRYWVRVCFASDGILATGNEIKNKVLVIPALAGCREKGFHSNS